MKNMNENELNMKRFYDTIADKYDYIFPLSPMQKKFLDEEVEGKKILDVGAATGKLTEYLSGKGLHREPSLRGKIESSGIRSVQVVFRVKPHFLKFEGMRFFPE